MSNFAEETKGMNSVEILNYYRNLYHCEPNTTEKGIVAWAINDILPTYVNAKEIRAKAIDEVFDFLKTQRKGIFMRVDFDDLEIRQYKEQMKEGV